MQPYINGAFLTSLELPQRVRLKTPAHVSESFGTVVDVGRAGAVIRWDNGLTNYLEFFALEVLVQENTIPIVPPDGDIPRLPEHTFDEDDEEHSINGPPETQRPEE